MFHVALWQPEIPPNTGNVARLCAATRTPLHLVGRVGFRTDDRTARRAGLDYWPHVTLHRHADIAGLEQHIASGRIWCVDNPAEQHYCDASFEPGDCLLFGSESAGLPAELRERFAPRCLGIPMLHPAVRSLNLATAVAVVLYEALRQRGFGGIA
jgi:tRNA (cytidine/uridine-2'-O-)-methyltransferase